MPFDMALRAVERPQLGPTAVPRSSSRGVLRPAHCHHLRFPKRSAWSVAATRAQRTPIQHSTPPAPAKLTGKAAERAREETAARQHFEAEAAEGSGDQGLRRVLLNSALALLEDAAATRKVGDASSSGASSSSLSLGPMRTRSSSSSSSSRASGRFDAVVLRSEATSCVLDSRSTMHVLRFCAGWVGLTDENCNACRWIRSLCLARWQVWKPQPSAVQRSCKVIALPQQTPFRQRFTASARFEVVCMSLPHTLASSNRLSCCADLLPDLEGRWRLVYSSGTLPVLRYIPVPEFLSIAAALHSVVLSSDIGPVHTQYVLLLYLVRSGRFGLHMPVAYLRR